MTAHKRVLNSELLAKLFFPLVGFFLAPATHAQSVLHLPEQLTADVIDTRGVTQTLSGNVRLRYKGVLLFCDQAVHRASTHTVSAYGHVLIVQGDSITARGDSALFTYADRHLLVYGRVMFQDHRTILTTNQLDYDLSAGVVTYTRKGRIVNEKDVLTSLKGTYNIQLKQFTCQQSVQLATLKNTIKSESLVYNTVTQRSAVLPKVIYPAATEQRVTEKPAQPVAESLVPDLVARQPVVATVTSAPVTKPAVTNKPARLQPIATPETKAKPMLVTTQESQRTVSDLAVSASTKPDVTFSSTVYTASPPTFRQAVQTKPARPVANTYAADLSDLELELNKKKRFH